MRENIHTYIKLEHVTSAICKKVENYYTHFAFIIAFITKNGEKKHVNVFSYWRSPNYQEKGRRKSRKYSAADVT